MKKVLQMVFVFGLLINVNLTLQAQNKTVTGTVTSADDGSALPGVSVVVKGTTFGTTTDTEGRYSLSAPDNAVLVFSFIGLFTQEIALGNRSVLNVRMESDIKSLGEVVVTAVGIERQKREIGYAVQQIKGDQITQRAEPNVINALQGKLAGVEIISSSGAPGSSSQIFIRGLSSITGNNQALFVVDGIPIDNSTNFTSNPSTGGSAYSNRALDLNPNDIESINVLKGPAAAVLYGSRAGNGAVIITTKKGKVGENKKFEVAVASSLTFQNVYGLPKYQNEYGQGQNFRYNAGVTDSWGPKFGTPGVTTVPTVTGSPLESLQYQAYPDNVKDFFKTGKIYDNGISLSGGSEGVTYIFSANSTNQTGVFPNTSLDRLTLRAGGTAKLIDGLSVEGSILYVNTQQEGIPQGNSGSSPWFTLPFIPRSFDLSNYPYKDAPGVQTPSLFSSLGRDNPYWTANESFYTSDVNRAVSIGQLNYQPSFLKGLTVTYRLGLDQYTDKRLEAIAYGSYNSNGNTAANRRGSQIYDDLGYQQFNQDIFAVYTRNLTSDLNLRVTLGNQINQIKTSQVNNNAQDLITPEFYNLSNHTSTTITATNQDTKRRLVGAYGQVGLGFKNWLFLELAARNDWSSTLPANKNSYFYPAVSLGWVFTDAFKIKNDILSYGKLRGNYALVGQDANTYLTNTVYIASGYGNNVAGITFPFAGSTASSTRSNRQGNMELEPEFKKSYEIGTELGFFNGRVNLDLNYFNNTTTNQIFNITVPGSTGFGTFTQNGGKIENKGIEASVNANVVTAGDFKWDINANFTRLRSKVIELAPGLEQFSLLTGGNVAGFSGAGPVLQPGKPFGVLQGTKFKRNDAGKFIIDPITALPVLDQNIQIIGDPNADWWGSLGNTFSYKGISLNVLLQYVSGGDFYSRQTQIARFRGALEEQTDRERPYMFEGVLAGPDGSATEQPNNIAITASDYWIALNNASEFAVFDATVLRLREVTLAYDFPKSLLGKTPFSSAKFSLSGRNLLFYAPNLPHADPEANQLGGNNRGFEFNSPPSTRNYGVNLRFTF
jgi:TonB-linked SusC/RagA family outer membrane protein